MDDCIFCKIIAGEIPASKVYENDDVFAFMDIQPVNKGHILIIPKQHYEQLTDIPDSVLAAILQSAKRVALGMKEVLTYDGFNVIQRNGVAAGQEVMHFHMHLVPRFRDDGLNVWSGRESYAEGEMNELSQKIAIAIDN